MDEKKEAGLLIPGMDIKPPIRSLDQAISIAEKNYGVTVKSITEINAYDDRNYHIIIFEENIKNPYITEVWSHGYVLKIMNSLDSKDVGFVDAQNQLMLHICSSGIRTSEPIKTIEGDYYKIESFQRKDGSHTSHHVVRLLKYQPGVILKNVSSSTSSLSKLFLDVGIKTAILNNHMKEFYHDAYNNRTSVWQMKNAAKIREFLFAVKDAEKVKLVLNVLEEFENTVLKDFNHLQRGLIHADLNESNILVEPCTNNENEHESMRVCAIIDYGDTHVSAYVLELATTMCYMLLQSKSIDSGASVVQGYHKMNPLPISEYKLLPISVCTRLCQSLVIGLYTAALDPTNQYVLQTQSAGWQLLSQLTSTEMEKINNLWLRNII